jgi:hypothetical protein
MITSSTIQFEVVPDGGSRLGVDLSLRAGHRGPHVARLLEEIWNEDLSRKAICMAVAFGARVQFAGALSEIKIVRSDGTSTTLNPSGSVVPVVPGLSVWAS